MIKLYDHFERSRAKAEGKTRYFTGKPCPKSHVSERMVVNGRCVECMREYKNTPEYKKRNLELIKADLKRNPEKYAIRQKKHYEKFKKTPKAKLNCVMSYGTRRALKYGKAGKSWKKFVTYTVDDLVKHIERQFVKGMTWDNYGTKWEVDHILPISGFNFSSPDDESFKLCFALSNMRPLCKKENNRKRAKRTHLL